MDRLKDRLAFLLDEENQLMEQIDKLESGRPKHVGPEHLSAVLHDLINYPEGTEDEKETKMWFKKGVIAEMEAADPFCNPHKILKDYRLAQARKAEIHTIQTQLSEPSPTHSPLRSAYSDVALSPRPELGSSPRSTSRAGLSVSQQSPIPSPMATMTSTPATTTSASNTHSTPRYERYPYASPRVAPPVVPGVDMALIQTMLTPIRAIRMNLRRTGVIDGFMRLSGDVTRFEFTRPGRTATDSYITIARITKADWYAAPIPKIFIQGGVDKATMRIMEFIVTSGQSTLVAIDADEAKRWRRGVAMLLKHRHDLFKVRCGLRGL